MLNFLLPGNFTLFFYCKKTNFTKSIVIQMTDNCNMIHNIKFEDKEIILVGTAHVSKESAACVASAIDENRPDTVCVELCESRYQSMRDKENWRNMDIIKVIKEKKAFLLLMNLFLASFQKRIANKLDIRPGEEMIQAIESAEKAGAAISLADRDIHITMSRIWRFLSLWDKLKIFFQLVLSFGQVNDISEEDVEKMKQQDLLESLLAEFDKSLPVLKEILVNERDRYLAQKIKTAPGKKIVAVVGAGHVPGIKKCFKDHIDIKSLEYLPPKSRLSAYTKWALPVIILAIFIFGFYSGGASAGKNMLLWWVLANGILAGIGAAVALAHPLTILSSIVAAPLTSLNPMIAAGWVSGLVEAFASKPKVKDLENLPEDIASIRGFWSNKITRILLIILFTNIGSALGTFVAIPLMMRVV